jgi:predicted solute-binding protein
LEESFSKPHLGAVSYLNTVPLVWGMLHGPQRDEVQLTFSLPSACAERVQNKEIDVGLVPVAEIARQGLEIVPGVGIACLGAVRSILLFSRVPWKNVRHLAVDRGSKTSVELARIILRERFGVEPAIVPEAPEIDRMLSDRDAALIIGDPALRLNPEKLPFECLDLGAEWLRLTNHPMVFAAWAGKLEFSVARLSAITRGSYEFGKAHLDEIVAGEHEKRRISRELAEQYLRQHIRFDLGPREQLGLEAFLELADLKSPLTAGI